MYYENKNNCIIFILAKPLCIIVNGTEGKFLDVLKSMFIIPIYKYRKLGYATNYQSTDIQSL